MRQTTRDQLQRRIVIVNYTNLINKPNQIIVSLFRVTYFICYAHVTYHIYMGLIFYFLRDALIFPLHNFRTEMKTYFLFGVLSNEIRPLSHFLGRDLFTISLTTTLHLVRAINRASEPVRLMKRHVTTFGLIFVQTISVSQKMKW